MFFVLLSALLLTGFPAKAFEDMPLSVAVTRPTTSHVAVLEMVQRGEDPDTPDKDGMTPLMLAARHAKDPLIIDVLISSGAKVDRRNLFTGQTALFYALRYSKDPKVPRALLRYGASVSLRDLRGRGVTKMLADNPALPADLLDDYLTIEEGSPSSGESASR